MCRKNGTTPSMKIKSKRTATLSAFAAMTLSALSLSACGKTASGTGPDPFRDSLYREFPAPLKTFDDLDDFNIFWCLNRPMWIVRTATCDAVDGARKKRNAG